MRERREEEETDDTKRRERRQEEKTDDTKKKERREEEKTDDKKKGWDVGNLQIITLFFEKINVHSLDLRFELTGSESTTTRKEEG